MAIYNLATMRGYGSAWSHRGYFGAGNVEELLNCLDGKPALVCGSGRGVFEQFEKHFDGSQAVFAVNDVAIFLAHVDHLVGLHAEKLEHWAALRNNGRPVGNRNFKTHTAQDCNPNIDYQWQGLESVMPLSGYFAMQIAWIMGAGSIALLGCPGDDTPRFWETRATNPSYGQAGVVQLLKSEMVRLPEFKKIVRSADGWTAEYFGRV